MPESDRDDDESAQLSALQQEARRLTEEGRNRITAGTPGEPVLFEVVQQGVRIRRLPDDPLALRISIGAPPVAPDTGKSAYLVFRGDPKLTVALLRRVLASLEQAV
jgi:hypothetical protein